MPHRFAPLLCALLMFALPSHAHADEPATAPATAATTSPANELAKVQEIELKLHEQETRFYPTTRASKIADIVQLSVEEDDLVLRTTFNPLPDTKLILEGATRRFITISIEGEPAGGRPYKPENFAFRQFDYSKSDVLLENTEVTRLPGHLMVTRVAEGPGKFLNVQLIQSGSYLLEEDSDGDKIRLVVQKDMDSPEGENRNLSARNFADLRRKYPKEVAEYLEPIFRDLGQAAALFRLDQKLVWQILGDASMVPEETKRKLSQVIQQLDADSPQARDEASKALEEIGQPAAVLLRNERPTDLSAEQNSRIETFLASLAPVEAETVAALRSDPQFLALALSIEDAGLRKAALERLRDVTGKPIEFDLEAPADQRMDAAMKLSQSLAPATQPATQEANTESEAPDQSAVPAELQDAAP